MPDFVDNFNGPTGERVDSDTTGWRFRNKVVGGSAHAWHYDKGCINRPNEHDTLIYRAAPVVAGGTYDVRARFQAFDFAELMLRYGANDALQNARIGILVQEELGKVVARDQNGEILLHSWRRNRSTEYTLYAYVSGNLINVFDSGAPTQANHVWQGDTGYQAASTGIGLSNGRCASIEIRDFSTSGVTVLDLAPIVARTRSEGNAHVVDEVTDPAATPMLENFAGAQVRPYNLVEGEPVAVDGGALWADLMNDPAGEWRVFVRAPGLPTRDIVTFRGMPTQFQPWTLADPFGPTETTILLPAVTLWDTLGAGDCDWITPDTEIEISFEPLVALPSTYPGGRFVWEGLLASFDQDDDGLAISCTGAMLQADLYLAKPGFPSRPIPYELAIAAQFQDRAAQRLRPLLIEWPDWWDTFYEEDTSAPLYMRPAGLKNGDPWTGLVTRQTGSFDQSLSSYVQTLLSSMYTTWGRWTLSLDPGRQPVLRHRMIKTAPDSSCVVIDPAAPGVKLRFAQDWSQSANVIYGQGTSLAGEGYSGQDVTIDGQRTDYVPLAAKSDVEPQEGNPDLVLSRLRREILLELQQGLSLPQAKKAAQAHLERFSDPGVTGTVTLASDPKLDDVWLPRKLIKEGMTIHLLRVRGAAGLLATVTKVSTDLFNQTTTLTFDTKWRDAITVDAVRLRGRDSLAITRQLIGGQYTPPIPDQLVPWNYAEGSGYIPSDPRGVRDSRRLWAGMRTDMDFPWQDMTIARPPKDPAWKDCYIDVGGASIDADDNWAQMPVSEGGDSLLMAFPVRAAQQASVRLLQIAAYDEDGYLMKVPFHVSFYSAYRTNVSSMPRLSEADADGLVYEAGQHYPFFPGAWEKYRADGTQVPTEEQQAVSSAGLIRGYGTHFVPAGYWPHTPGEGQPTGMLVDEGTFEIDTTRLDPNFNPYQPRQKWEYTGYIYAMIYCDAQGGRPVYFLGRIFRQEPGATV